MKIYDKKTHYSGLILTDLVVSGKSIGNICDIIKEENSKKIGGIYSILVNKSYKVYGIESLYNKILLHEFESEECPLCKVNYPK
jgi:hypothetical protein